MIRNQDNTALMMSSLYAFMKIWVSVFLNCSHRKSARCAHCLRLKEVSEEP